MPAEAYIYKSIYKLKIELVGLSKGLKGSMAPTNELSMKSIVKLIQEGNP